MKLFIYYLFKHSVTNSVLYLRKIGQWLIHTEWPKKMYALFTDQYLWNKLWQCLDADGGHFEHLHWIQNSRTSLISILLLYKYSCYDYRVIFFISKCVYIILGHSVTQLSGMYCVLAVRINCINSLFGLASRKNSLHQVPHEISFLGLSVSIKEQMKFLKSLEKSILICLELFHC